MTILFRRASAPPSTIENLYFNGHLSFDELAELACRTEADWARVMASCRTNFGRDQIRRQKSEQAGKLLLSYLENIRVPSGRVNQQFIVTTLTGRQGTSDVWVRQVGTFDYHVYLEVKVSLRGARACDDRSVRNQTFLDFLFRFVDDKTLLDQVGKITMTPVPNYLATIVNLIDSLETLATAQSIRSFAFR